MANMSLAGQPQQAGFMPTPLPIVMQPAGFPATQFQPQFPPQ
jgi:hypothetical protein